MKISELKIVSKPHKNISIRDISYSVDGKIVEYTIETIDGLKNKVKYEYFSSHIMRKEKNHILHYLLKNGLISQLNHNDTVIKYRYTNNKLNRITQITGEEITEYDIKWDNSTISEIKTYDNFLGDQTETWHKSVINNNIYINLAVIISGYHNVIDMALMMGGYYGKCEKYLPSKVEYRLLDETEVISTLDFSYLLKSNDLKSVMISDEEETITRIDLTWKEK